MGSREIIAEDIPKGLEEEGYYHGLLPREDCSEILNEVGDFLVRVSQPRPTDPREVIVSVRVSKDQSPQSIRHVIVKKQKLPKGEIAWVAIEAIKFQSFFELIEHYTKKGNPINPELETSVLVTGVKRQRWELTHEDVILNKVLGAGAFGEVRSGEVTIDKKKFECAVKIVSTCCLVFCRGSVVLLETVFSEQFDEYTLCHQISIYHHSSTLSVYILLPIIDVGILCQ
ncbi:unnamed protein product [Gongylonema pulchrum]|uniref:SH2 domain-containing protein n=1 Tax=Gongylonema pulchrum TaxID=637853 RepID=A0A183D6S7_9BILA|nr:unnamed protein product [Gongylonema pulchrum]